MCRGIARHLQPGGRFVAINENPEQPEERYTGYLRYGFSKTVASPRREGSPISYAMISGRELIPLRGLPFRAHHLRACNSPLPASSICAGIPCGSIREGVTAMGADYWAEYLDNPPVVGLSCRLPG